jgi:hypothetical protein
LKGFSRELLRRGSGEASHLVARLALGEHSLYGVELRSYNLYFLLSSKG